MTARRMPNEPLIRANLKTPKAAAIAGMLFSVLLVVDFWLLRTSIPADPQEPGSWLQSNSRSVALALNLMPFAGIAFLWIIGAILIAFATHPQELIGSATFHFARAAAYSLVNVYMIKMASVFMITTSTVAIYTGIAPRWLALLGYALSLLLLFGSYYFSWSFLVFPVWVFLLSVCILKDSIRRPSGHHAKGGA